MSSAKNDMQIHLHVIQTGKSIYMSFKQTFIEAWCDFKFEFLTGRTSSKPINPIQNKSFRLLNTIVMCICFTAKVALNFEP